MKTEESLYEGVNGNQDYPYFKEKTLKAIQNVDLIHGYHLYWPDLDVDLEIDNLVNPEKYPLKCANHPNQQMPPDKLVDIARTKNSR